MAAAAAKKPKNVVPKSAAKVKKAEPRGQYCRRKGKFDRKKPTVLLNATHTVRMKKKELQHQFKSTLVHEDALPRVYTTFHSAAIRNHVL